MDGGLEQEKWIDGWMQRMEDRHNARHCGSRMGYWQRVPNGTHVEATEAGDDVRSIDETEDVSMKTALRGVGFYVALWSWRRGRSNAIHVCAEDGAIA